MTVASHQALNLVTGRVVPRTYGVELSHVSHTSHESQRCASDAYPLGRIASLESRQPVLVNSSLGLGFREGQGTTSRPAPDPETIARKSVLRKRAFLTGARGPITRLVSFAFVSRRSGRCLQRKGRGWRVLGRVRTLSIPTSSAPASSIYSRCRRGHWGLAPSSSATSTWSMTPTSRGSPAACEELLSRAPTTNWS